MTPAQQAALDRLKNQQPSAGSTATLGGTYQYADPATFKYGMKATKEVIDPFNNDDFGGLKVGWSAAETSGDGTQPAGYRGPDGKLYSYRSVVDGVGDGERATSELYNADDDARYAGLTSEYARLSSQKDADTRNLQSKGVPTWQGVYNDWLTKEYTPLAGADLNRAWNADSDSTKQKEALDKRYTDALAAYNAKNGTDYKPDTAFLGADAQPNSFTAPRRSGGFLSDTISHIGSVVASNPVARVAVAAAGQAMGIPASVTMAALTANDVGQGKADPKSLLVSAILSQVPGLGDATGATGAVKAGLNAAGTSTAGSLVSGKNIGDSLKSGATAGITSGVGTLVGDTVKSSLAGSDALSKNGIDAIARGASATVTSGGNINKAAQGAAGSYLNAELSGMLDKYAPTVTTPGLSDAATKFATTVGRAAIQNTPGYRAVTGAIPNAIAGGSRTPTARTVTTPTTAPQTTAAQQAAIARLRGAST